MCALVYPRYQHVSEDSWEVDALLDRRIGAHRRREYLVRWTGWGAENDSWEPHSFIDAELVQAYDVCNDGFEPLTTVSEPL